MKKIEAGGFLASVICVLLSMCIVPAKGQENISVPYFCGFEDSTENSHWVLNSGVYGHLCNDKWYISSSTANEGHNSLYISSDGGVNTFFGIRQPNVVVAYREMILPVGTYDVSFDWKNMAEQDGGMYVCTVVDDDLIPYSSLMGFIPLWAYNTAQQFNGTQNVLRGSQRWSNASFLLPVTVPDLRMKLAFVWVNNHFDSLINPLAASVDNIQITSAMTSKPYNFNVVSSSCDSVRLSWDGTSSNYELDYRCGSDIWSRIEVQDRKHTFYNLQEGAYDFRVRGIVLNSIPSAWVSNYSAIVFCPEDNCINYVDLTRVNGVKCYIGETGLTGVHNLREAIIDYGHDDMESRHTVCLTQGQYDPRTGNKLRTIPEGELASVRLGNWNAGGEVERIEYAFTVDSISNILLLKYAIVLEDPGHPKALQPKFTLEIFDDRGNFINPYCGAADFYADYNLPGWNSIPTSYGVVTWKDWTTLGLNLTDYIGQTLTIRLTTRDCAEGGHFGYAYFSLGCTEGKIKGVSSGDSPVIEFEAPDGFDYEWSNSDNTGILSVERKLTIDATDISTYYCKCSSKEENECYFVLSTVVDQRFPQASFSYEITAKDCQNVVKFRNNSRVLINKDGVETEKDEPCENYIWLFNENEQSQEAEPEYIFPKEGGVFPVTLIASIADGQCEDDTTINITIEPIYEDFDTIYDMLCSGERLLFCDEYTMVSDEYVCVKPNRFGCDSTVTLKLTVLPVDTTYFSDTITVDELPYEYGELYFNEETRPGTYEDTIHISTGNCYDVLEFSLVVEESEVGKDETYVSDLLLTPNPVRIHESVMVNLELTDAERKGLTVSVYSDTGALVQYFTPETQPIVISNLNTAGIFMVRIVDGTGKVYIGKIVVK